MELSHLFTQKRWDDNIGLFTSKKIAKGEIIMNLEGEIKPTPDKYSVQLSLTKHIYSDSHPFRYLNHACQPNAVINRENRTVIALTDIAENCEITFHYCSTEDVMASPFFCNCGAENCVGEVRGFRFLKKTQKREIVQLQSFARNFVTVPTSKI